MNKSLICGKTLRNAMTIMGIFNGEYAYKGPDCVQIDLTNDCNNNCIACWCNSPLLKDKATPQAVKRQSIDYRVAKRLIDTLKKMHTAELYFSGGGEPLMHPAAIEIISYAKKRGFKCHLHTNFTLVDEDMLAAFKRIKLDYLVVSLWAATAETYVKTHPNKTQDDFIRIRQLLTLLNRTKGCFPKVKIYNVISNLNYQELLKMAEFCLETASEEVEFTVVDTIPGCTDTLLFQQGQADDVLAMCRLMKENKEYCTQKGRLIISNFEQFMRRVESEYAGAAEYDRGFIDSIPCYVGWLFARVLADGNVNSCLKSHRIPIGNLYKDNFDKIWNNAKQRMFRRCMQSKVKDHDLLSFIGNDPGKKIGCYKSCDDLGRNMIMHQKINKLSPVQVRLLKTLATVEWF
ncbi:MAG: radical SAM protein [Candidatus Omnitrophota bacterium]